MSLSCFTERRIEVGKEAFIILKGFAVFVQATRGVRFALNEPNLFETLTLEELEVFMRQILPEEQVLKKSPSGLFWKLFSKSLWNSLNNFPGIVKWLDIYQQICSWRQIWRRVTVGLCFCGAGWLWICESIYWALHFAWKMMKKNRFFKPYLSITISLTAINVRTRLVITTWSFEKPGATELSYSFLGLEKFLR